MNNNNPYIDINYKDRSQEIERAYAPTLEDIKNDPEFYAELVNDLMFHWMHGTRETQLMNIAKDNYKTRYSHDQHNDEADYDYDDSYDDDSHDYDNGYTHSQQCYADRSDYARQLYESGRIDHIQMAEMRMGA